MEKSDNSFTGYLKFAGPSVDNGEIHIRKVGKSLLALDKIFRKYNKVYNKDNDSEFQIKLKDIKKGSTSVHVTIEQIIPIAGPVSIYIIAKSIGVTELGKQFFGTIGKQLALKIFSKGKRVEEKKTFLKKEVIYIELVNTNGETKNIPVKDWEDYKLLYADSRDLVQIEPEERMTIGYKEDNNDYDLATINYQEKEYFDSDLERSIEDRDKDPFDDDKAEKIKIIGRFVDFYGLAYKYPFAFQARKKQDIVGKQKILCMVKEEDISKIINYLKPEKSTDVCIFGKAIKDFDGKIDKIKIEWFSEDFNFDPKQTNIV